MVGVAGFEPATPTSRTRGQSQKAAIFLEERRSSRLDVRVRFAGRRTDSVPVALAPLPHANGRLRKRASAGVCPCCNRTFSQLARHMQTKHPTFIAQEIAGNGVAKHDSLPTLPASGAGG